MIHSLLPTTSTSRPLSLSLLKPLLVAVMMASRVGGFLCPRPWILQSWRPPPIAPASMRIATTAFVSPFRRSYSQSTGAPLPFRSRTSPSALFVGASGEPSTPQRPPQQPPQRRPSSMTPRRPYSSTRRDDENWVVPKSIDIPIDLVDVSFARSSGAGGQNVNKVNTKVELRFHVMDALWLPEEVRERLFEQQRSRINKRGYLGLTCQEHRSQEKNRKAALAKLEGWILEAYPRPKERKMRTGISRAAKERNKEAKRKRGLVKQQRRKVDSRDF